MAGKKTESLSSKVGKAVTGTFSLDKFKKGKNLGQSSSNFKPQAWINFTLVVSAVFYMRRTAKSAARLTRTYAYTLLSKFRHTGVSVF